MASFLYVTSCRSCRKISILVGLRCLHSWDSSTLKMETAGFFAKVCNFLPSYAASRLRISYFLMFTSMRTSFDVNRECN